MLIQHLPVLSKQYIVLASASPRRAELLQGLGLKASIIPSTFDENLDKSAYPCPGDYALETAKHKAVEVSRLIEHGRLADLVIGADTVVELDGRVLEKPEDAKDAHQMLSSLSGRQHTVYTGVSLVLPNARDPRSGQAPVVRGFWEETKVQFAELEAEAIDAYVASKEPMGKAGAYGIQVGPTPVFARSEVAWSYNIHGAVRHFLLARCKGIGGSFVKGIHGCYFNVMGFPVHRFSVEIDNLIKAGYFESELVA